MIEKKLNDSFDIRYQNESDTTCSSLVQIVSMLTEHNQTKSKHNKKHKDFLFRCFSTSPANKGIVTSKNKDIIHKAKQKIKKKKNKKKTDSNINAEKIPSSNNSIIPSKNKLTHIQRDNPTNKIFSYATLSKKEKECINVQINVTNNNNINTLFKYSTTINTKNPFSYSNYASLISIRKRMHQTLYK